MTINRCESAAMSNGSDTVKLFIEYHSGETGSFEIKEGSSPWTYRQQLAWRDDKGQLNYIPEANVRRYYIR